jgi:hypothetical protein
MSIAENVNIASSMINQKICTTTQEGKVRHSTENVFGPISENGLKCNIQRQRPLEGDMIKVVTIKRYEMICRSRWGWHWFRGESAPGKKDYAGRIIGFRFLGIGLILR